MQVTNAGERELRISTLQTRVVGPDGAHPQWAAVHYRHQNTVVRVGLNEDHLFILCPLRSECTSTSTTTLTATNAVTLMATLDGALTQEPGEATATLEIQSNDPYMPTAQIPVQLVVTELPIVAMVLPTE